jgi:ribonuclease Z
MMRWHSESFSFLPTSYKGGQDGYDIIATELNWKPDMGGVQTWNSGTGATTSISPGNIAYQTDEVKISFFPAVHDRNGSISYKLEWINQGLSMIFSGDTKPNTSMIANATGGVDVLIHEMVVPPEIWANRNSGLMPDGSPEWTQAYNAAKAIQDNSHTPQMALGYILSQLEKPPRLAVATHFQASDDTIGPALDDIRFWYQGPVAIATDLMVINVSKKSIRQRRAVVSEYVWNTPVQVDSNNLNAAKYNGPYAQFDQSLLDTVIPPCDYDPASCSSAAAKRR